LETVLAYNFEKEFNNLIAVVIVGNSNAHFIESIEESKNFTSNPLKTNVTNVIKKKN